MSSFLLSLEIGELHIRSSPPPNVRPISVIFPNPCPVLAGEAARKAREAQPEAGRIPGLRGRLGS